MTMPASRHSASDTTVSRRAVDDLGLRRFSPQGLARQDRLPQTRSSELRPGAGRTQRCDRRRSWIYQVGLSDRHGNTVHTLLHRRGPMQQRWQEVRARSDRATAKARSCGRPPTAMFEFDHFPIASIAMAHREGRLETHILNWRRTSRGNIQLRKPDCRNRDRAQLNLRAVMESPSDEICNMG